MKAIPSVVLQGSTFPVRLSDLPEPPKRLYVRGELPRGPSVAVVGTRSPTAEGAAFASSLASDLVRGGVAVLSGGALGIDSAAHRGALAAGGVTVVVAPAGYFRPFPEENAELFEDIVAGGGAYVSLVEDDAAATRAAFFARNACLAALSWALVVVEAGFRSGARNAGAAARRLGRPFFVVPSAPWIPKGRGCLEELRRGARICTSASDILEVLAELGAQLMGGASDPSELAAPGRPSPEPRQLSWLDGSSSFGPEPSAAPPVSEVASPQRVSPLNEGDELELASRVTRAVAAGAHEAGAVAELVGLPVAVVNRILLTLRLQGVLVSAAPGHIALRKSSD